MSTCSNVATSSARDCEHDPALQLVYFTGLWQPVRAEGSLVSPPAMVKNFIQHPVDPQPPSDRKEDYQLGCCEGERQARWIASRYNDSFAHHSTGAPDSWLRVCYEEDATSLPPLLAQCRPLQKEFLLVCIVYAELPRLSVILKTMNICCKLYGYLHEYRHPTVMNGYRYERSVKKNGGSLTYKSN
jgi:hypothetical protein